jgi:hypothetical protein
MREYESEERENKYTALPRYYKILKYDCGIQGFKFGHKHDC